MAVFIPYLWSILSAVSDNPSTYGMTANALLSCADLFLLFVCRPIVFFLFRHRSCFTLSKIYFGYPQLFNAFLMCTSSLSLSSSVDTSISFLSINVLTTPDLWCIGWWDWKCRYWSVCVGLRYTCILTVLSGWQLISKSKKGITQVSHNRSCSERNSCHKLVRCQNFGKRRTSENQTGQGIDLDPERTHLHEQRWRGIQLTDSLWPSFGHVLNMNITWPQAWWSSPLASDTSQLI